MLGECQCHHPDVYKYYLVLAWDGILHWHHKHETTTIIKAHSGPVIVSLISSQSLWQPSDSLYSFASYVFKDVPREGGARIQLMDRLISRCEDLSKKEAQVTLELRRNGGHGGKISNTVLFWLEDAERIQTRLSVLKTQQDRASTHHRNVEELTHEVECLLTNASSSLVFNARYRGDRTVHTQPLIGKRTQHISNEMWKYLIDPEIGKIGLYGLSGAGKTTIMKNINSKLTSADIFDRIIWVTLSENMSLKNLQNDIAMRLCLTLSPYSDSEVWASKISGALRKLKNCLLIFDDIWEPIILEKIGILQPTKENGCKLVLITRFKSLCDGMRVDRSIHVKPLSEDEAWDLFVSRAGTQVLDDEIKSVAKEFVHACRGLPITIITIACAMRNEVTLDSWRKASRHLRATSSKLVRFGYRRLKSEAVGKCFLSCAFFPKDYRFEPNELVGYWIAEDFIHTEGGILESIKEGHEILKELKDSNLLESFMEDDNERLQMHDLFRDLAICIMDKEHGFLTRAGWGTNEFPQMFHLKRARKLSLIRTQIDRLHDITVCYNLSTLLLTYNSLSYISPTFFNGLPHLHLLDMSYSGINCLPASLSRLARLQVLRLQYCTSLKKISSLENLKELQVLNLRGTLIKELPQGIKKLLKLRSLDLSETVRLKYIQEGIISCLSNLQELQLQGSRLCQMESAMVANCLKEIRCLEQLAILTLSGVGVEDHLDTILHLQRYKLKVFSINVYSSALDYIDDM